MPAARSTNSDSPILLEFETIAPKPGEVIIVRTTDGSIDDLSIEAIELVGEALRGCFPDNRCVLLPREWDLATSPVDPPKLGRSGA